VNSEPLRELDVWLDRFRRFWTPHLEALTTELARGRRERRLASPRPAVHHRREGKESMIDVTQQINAVRRRVGTRV
jgi:hypothetical protein